MVGARRAKQPTVAPKAATSHMDVLCLSGAQEDTEVKRQKSASKASAAMRQAGVRIIRVRRSGVPKINAARIAVTTAGIIAFWISVPTATAG